MGPHHHVRHPTDFAEHGDGAVAWPTLYPTERALVQRCATGKNTPFKAVPALKGAMD